MAWLMFRGKAVLKTIWLIEVKSNYERKGVRQVLNLYLGWKNSSKIFLSALEIFNDSGLSPSTCEPLTRG